jgi:two-component system, LytTR family, sensor kinase
MSKKAKEWALHIGIWLLFFVYEWLFKQGVYTNASQSLFHFNIVAIRVVVLMGAVYFTLYVLAEHLFLKGRKGMFLLSLLLTIVAATFVMKTLNHFLILQGTPFDKGGYLPSIISLQGWLIFMGNIAFNISFALMLYLISKWARQERERKELETAKKEAELQLLKSQVQPHFIFNTLNNLYSLSLKNSPHTPGMIYRLSALLEYMLYDSSQDWIPLEKELSYIRSYIELEQIRYGNRLDVAINLFDTPQDLSIPSLTLLPFVENSFKWGLSQQTGPCWLRMDISEASGWLSIKIENSKPETPIPPIKKGGLGLQNVRKRLDILYREDWELRLFDEPESFLVVLKLKTAIPPIRHEQPAQKLEVLSH